MLVFQLKVGNYLYSFIDMCMLVRFDWTNDIFDCMGRCSPPRRM